MSFDMGIYDTVFLIIGIGFAAWAYFFVKPRHDEHDHAADE